MNATQPQFVHNAPDTDSVHDAANMWNNVEKSDTNDPGYRYTMLVDSLYKYRTRVTADAGLTEENFFGSPLTRSSDLVVLTHVEIELLDKKTHYLNP